MPRPNLLKAVRLTHLYFGVFIAPALIFFAFTGFIQTAGLHEVTRERPNYKPAHWIAVLAQIHKKQVATLPTRKPQPPATPTPAASATPETPEAAPHHKQDAQPAPLTPTASAAPQPASPKHNPYPMRFFFFIVSVGLLVSTLTGLYMSYTYTRNKLAITLTLLAGIILPPLLLLF